MTQYEEAVLKAVRAKDPAYIGWYAIEQQLSMMELNEREYLPDTLKRLLLLALLEENPAEQGKVRLTALGRSALIIGGDVKP